MTARIIRDIHRQGEITFQLDPGEILHIFYLNKYRPLWVFIHVKDGEITKNWTHQTSIDTRRSIKEYFHKIKEVIPFADQTMISENTLASLKAHFKNLEYNHQCYHKIVGNEMTITDYGYSRI